MPATTDWDARAERYDDEMRVGFPGYEALHALVPALIEAALERPPTNVLSVGCGTGEEMARIAVAYPECRFTGVDPSPGMLERARVRLGAAGMMDRVALIPGSIAEVPAEPSFDGATLMLVMHFLPDDGTKAALLAAIAKRLQRGAPLVVASMFADDFAVDDLHWRAWRTRIVADGAPADRIDTVLEDARASMHRVSETRMRDLLGGAGFRTPARVFQALHAGAWVAVRA